MDFLIIIIPNLFSFTIYPHTASNNFFIYDFFSLILGSHFKEITVMFYHYCDLHPHNPPSFLPMNVFSNALIVTLVSPILPHFKLRKRYDLLFFGQHHDIVEQQWQQQASKQTFNFVGSASKSNKLQFFLFLSLSTHFFHCLIQIFFLFWAMDSSLPSSCCYSHFQEDSFWG